MNNHKTYPYEDDPQDEIEDLSQTSFEEALKLLTETSDIVPEEQILRGLSNLDHEQINRLKPVWHSLSDNYRRFLMQMLVDYGENHFEVNYETLGIYALQDPSAGVRAAAVELLQETDSIDVMHRLIHLSSQDDNNLVRAEATRALGQFILLSELDQLPAERTRAAWQQVHELWLDSNQPVDVRCAALEALSNCSRNEVTAAIESAYDSDNDNLRLSAIIAMGNSCDSRWESILLDELTSDDLRMRSAAARAAGEIQSADAVPSLGLLLDGERDEQEAAIWALGEIGTREAVRLLRALESQSEDDEELLELIDEALANAGFSSISFGLIDLDDD